ncbi:phospholipase D/nuclease [Obba rivulosa]|uniref:Phospholipase D/nuclease n=1 Tax=Obba rivulosa TaxID=1052685 RepID=A0A8E2AL39_9APHY|nr:phospholipase D/nuclease [Obba rivulosa]
MADDGFQDEDVARAIALSLQESSAPPHRDTSNRGSAEVIAIADSDDEDAQFQADLQRAISASRQESADTRSTSPAQVTSSGVSPSPAQPSSRSTPALASGASNPFISDRAQMERERLARLKRLRPDLHSGEGEGEQPHAKRQHVSSRSSANRTANISTPSSAGSVSTSSSRSAPVASGSGVSGRLDGARGNTNVSPGEQMFWDGELRQIANKHVDPAKDTRPTFRLSDILAPRDEIEFAVLSAYCINWPWMYSFFNPDTPVIMVAQDQNGDETIKEVLPNWIKATPFLRNGMGCMHMKFMLLFYKSGRLRVAVSTANFVEYDWRDIENSVWLQDIPKHPVPIRHDPKADDFAAVWIRILRALNVAPALISLLRNNHPNLPLQRLEELRMQWDFSKVAVKLVPSLAGKHEGWPNVVKTGHTALMKAVRDIGAQVPKGKQVVLECQGSSIGTYSTQWMNEFHCSARGESAESWLDISRARRAKLPWPSVKILFPSLRTVRESVLGEPGGGTMFCRKNQWEAPKFPRELFHDSNSKRGKVLMHSKMIIATFRDASTPFKQGQSQTDSETEPESDVEEQAEHPRNPIGWAYIGSHNFTPSAWGTLSGSAFNPTLNITNYELGIVWPLYSDQEASRVACWERPPRKYVIGKDLPWMQSESPCFVEDR